MSHMTKKPDNKQVNSKQDADSETDQITVNEQHTKEALGLWQSGNLDSVQYQYTLRQEWE
jgi:hypothetical protein